MATKFNLIMKGVSKMCWPKQVKDSLMLSSVFAICISVIACAQLPQSMADLGWTDHRGDRGDGVLARDYQMCTELVEQRRSLMAGCMESRGWQTKGK